MVYLVLGSTIVVCKQKKRAFAATQALERAARAPHQPYARRVRCGADLAVRQRMVTTPLSPASLRAEARLLATAGILLLAFSFPITFALVIWALWTAASTPFLPAIIGAPPIMLGYLACFFASRRMVKAKAIETGRRTGARG